MLLKRKRSVSELSSPPSAFSRPELPAHLGGRTLKRFRDGRPSQDDIHRHTLNILFSAQRAVASSESETDAVTMPLSSAGSSPSAVDENMVMSAAPDRSQPSLHRFWRRVPAVTTTTTSTPTPAPIPPPLDGYAAESVDEDAMCIDDCGARSARCGNCGNTVAGSPLDAGDPRLPTPVCSHCVDRKVWVGGLGRVSEALTAC